MCSFLGAVDAPSVNEDASKKSNPYVDDPINEYGLRKSILDSTVKPGMKIGFGYRNYEEDGKIVVRASAVVDENGKISFIEDRGYAIEAKDLKVREVFKLILEREKALMNDNSLRHPLPWHPIESKPRLMKSPADHYKSSQLNLKLNVWFYGEDVSIDPQDGLAR